ncbi:Alkaline phosphatase, tissue-nonspecific isozyme-like 5, partial [Homarus americanus]
MVGGRCKSCLVMVLVLTLSTSAVIFPSPNARETETSFWFEKMRQEINDALERPKNTGRAKNVLFFLGDGMGITVSTVGRIFKGQKKGVSGEEGHLVWERFPNVGLI